MSFFVSVRPPTAAWSPALPSSEHELLARARALAGHAVTSLCAGEAGKGVVGEGVERALGVAVSNAAGPDILHLGVEIKTLPVRSGRVQQSTWVTSATPQTLANETWSTSSVKAKLARVLLVPIDVDSGCVGAAFLWSPDAQQSRALQNDWADLSDLVAHGMGWAVTARRGAVLQLRPKARRASERRTATLLSGERVQLPPLGFYLRRGFTQGIVDAAFDLTCRS